jgi:hypothetical protein
MASQRLRPEVAAAGRRSQLAGHRGQEPIKIDDFSMISWKMLSVSDFRFAWLSDRVKMRRLGLIGVASRRDALVPGKFDSFMTLPSVFRQRRRTTPTASTITPVITSLQSPRG